MRKIILFVVGVMLSQVVKAQQGFGTSNPEKSSVIDMVASNKGMLVPRVALTSIKDILTVPFPVNALTVFNTATTVVGTNDVTPGYYYWSVDTVTPANSKWVRLATAGDIQEPWYNQATNAGATANTQNIYQMGQVGINTTTPVGQLHVVNPTYALQSVFERTNTGLITGIAAGTTQFLYNTLTSSIATYTGSGVGKGAPYNGMSVGYNFAFKSNTDAIKDVAAINAGLVDYAGGKGQLNFIVNGSGTTVPSMVLASNGYLGIGTVTTATPNNPPTNSLHVKAASNPVRFEGLQTGAAGDNVVVADGTGVLKTVTAASLTPVTTNTLLAPNGNLVSTINGVANTPAVPVLISASNGLTAANGDVKLGGALATVGVTTITTDATHTLALAGLQTGAAGDKIVVADASGVLRTVTQTAVDLRLVGTNNHITLDAGVGGTGTSAGTGANNILLGSKSGNALTTGSSNILLALNAGKALTTGSGNIAIGEDALSTATTAVNNVAIGLNALKNNTATQNVAVGVGALQLNTTGGYNAGFGNQSLAANASGISNTAIGSFAMQANTIGNANVAWGRNALDGNVSGNNNVAIGNVAGNTLTAGDNNIFIGQNAQPNVSVTGANQLNIGNWIYGYNGKIGIGAAAINPSERFDVGETMRIRQLPADGATNAIYNGALTQTTTFTAAKMVVADANGVLGSMPLSATITAANGLTKNVNAIELGGTLSKATTIVTNSPATATLAITGLQPGTLTTPPTGGTGIAQDNIIVSAASGVLKTVPVASLAIEPWQVQGTTTQATGNAQNIYQSGSVAIGIASGTAIPAAEVTATNPKLYVEGNVTITGKYYTTNSVYADYVFEKYFNGSSTIDPNYRFKSLNEIEAFVKVNKHLPGVTPITATNKTKNGYSFDLTALSIQSLEKIEELYLHVIELNGKVNQKDQEIKTLQEKTKTLEERLNRLEQLIDKK